MADEWNATNLEQTKTISTKSSKQSYAKRLAEVKQEVIKQPEWDTGSINTENKHK